MNGVYLTIDTGTTNTRVTVLKDGALLAQAKSETGVRVSAIDGDNHRLKQAVRQCLDEALDRAGIGWDQVCGVAASGMITSNVGLCEIPHCTAPAGAAELAAAIQSVSMPEICPLPIAFIPGVKNSGAAVDWNNFEAMDIMRGEEVEAMALLSHFAPGKPYLLVLPGSHMKFVSVDREGRITGCLTSISGELLAAITTGTILADAVQRQFADPEQFDEQALLAGWRTAARTGLGRACFSGRILNQFAGQPPQAIAYYLLGAVLQSDVAAIRGSRALCVPPEAEVVVAGKDPLRRAIAQLLQADGAFAAVHLYTPEPGALPMAAEGVLRILEQA